MGGKPTASLHSEGLELRDKGGQGEGGSLATVPPRGDNLHWGDGSTLCHYDRTLQALRSLPFAQALSTGAAGLAWPGSGEGAGQLGGPRAALSTRCLARGHPSSLCMQSGLRCGEVAPPDTCALKRLSWAGTILLTVLKPEQTVL